MALWGNSDNLNSVGIVTVNYSTLEVIGSGTTFGAGSAGAAHTEVLVGDVIRFGSNASGGTYFGDAVVVGIASTTSLTIGSTAGLNGSAIADVQFTVSELPKSSTWDNSYSELEASDASDITIATVGASTNVAVGSSLISLDIRAGAVPDISDLLQVGDKIKIGANAGIAVLGVGTGQFLAGHVSAVGVFTAYFAAHSGMVPQLINSGGGGSLIETNGNELTIASIGSTGVTVTSGLTSAIIVGSGAQSRIKIKGDLLVSLGSTIQTGLTTDTSLVIQRRQGGNDKYVYGVAGPGMSTATRFETGVGWVGVQTYVDSSGELRTKKEILVAMSGITTGNVPAYPPA